MFSIKKRSIVTAFILTLALVLQACGGSGGNGGNGAQSQSSSNSGGGGGEAQQQAQTGGSGKAGTNVLNFGYVGSFPNIAGAEGWGYHKGILQEELAKYGITELNWIGFKVGPDLNEAVISGRVDMGHSGDSPAILNRAKGAKTRLITQSDIKVDANIIVRKADGPQTLEELAGKTVAVVKGSLMHRYLLGVINKHDIKDVKLISIGANTADSLAALAKGEIDAVAATPALVYELLDSGDFVLLDTASGDHPEFLSTHATVVTEEYLEKFPDLPKVWNEAREKALADLKAHPDEYYEYLAEVFGQSLEAVKSIYSIDTIAEVNFTDEGIERVNGTKNFLVEEKLAAQDFDINDWILK